jgi:hypothetical protein
MNRHIVYRMALGIAVIAVSSFAADEAPQALSTVSAEEIESTSVNADILERLEALESQAEAEAKSGWAGKVRVKGDVRYRFQHVAAEETDGSDLSTTKNIQRIRMRLGVAAEVNDFTTAGIGIRTGSKANSGNVTLGDNFDGFDVSVSLAYFTLAPSDAKYGSATFGKMKQPWKNSTDLIWDSDVNPEGIAYAYAGDYDAVNAFASAGYFRVEEENLTTDLNLASGQLGVALPLGEKVKLTAGGSAYVYENAPEFADPVLPGNYATDYTIVEGFAEAGIKDIGPVPFKLYGNYVNNTEADDENDGYCFGIKFGDAKKGKWEAKYDYRELGLYAAPAYFTDSDFADGGTGIEGHRIKGTYNFAKNLAGGLTYIYSQRTPARSLDQDQQFNTLMLDLMVKF